MQKYIKIILLGVVICVAVMFGLISGLKENENVETVDLNIKSETGTHSEHDTKMTETTKADTDGTDKIIEPMVDTETTEELGVEEEPEAQEEDASKNEEIPEQITEEDSADTSDEVLKEEDNHLVKILASTIYSQLVIVESSGTEAVVTMHEKTNGEWKEILRTDGYVGADGVGQAHENIAVTPQGEFSLSFAFGVKSNPGTSLPYLRVDEYDYWVGDSNSTLYNQYVRTDKPYTEWDDAEHLIDYPNDYAYALFIGYNIEGTPREGSCFFLHCSVGIPTAGCVAVPENDMIFILNHIGTDCGIVIY